MPSRTSAPNRCLHRTALHALAHLTIGSLCTFTISWTLAAFAHPENNPSRRGSTHLQPHTQPFDISLELWHSPGAMWAHSAIAPHFADSRKPDAPLPPLPRGTHRTVLPWLHGQ